MQFVLLRRSEPGAGLQFAFDTDNCSEVLIGRDPSCHVALDPNRDTLAGIFHARIVRDPKRPSGLIVIDMDSRNGTYLDGVPVRGQAVLSGNSSLLLGRKDTQNGPEFQVSIGETAWQIPAALPASEPAAAPPGDPWPIPVQMPSRQPEAAATFAQAAVLPQAQAPVHSPGLPAQPPVRQEAYSDGSKKWWDDNLPGVPSMQERGSGGSRGLPRNVNVKESRLNGTVVAITGVSVLCVLLAIWWISRGHAPLTWTPAEIEQTYGKSVMATDLSWKLVDGGSGRRLYHWRPPLPFSGSDPRRAVFQGKDHAAVFIRMPDGVIEPVLILGPVAKDGTKDAPKDNDAKGNAPVRGKASGSAVAVHSGGFVLTDRRNATPWVLPYEWPKDSFPGILVDPQTRQVDVIDHMDQKWTPQHARAVVANEPTIANLAAGALSQAQVSIEGKIDFFRVRPSSSTIWIQANPAVSSDGSELAVAKVQSSQPLSTIRIPEADPPLMLGEHVFVLGFTGPPDKAQMKAAEFQVLKAETSSLANSDEFAVLAGTLSGVSQTGSAVFDAQGRLAGLLRVVPRTGKEFQGEIVPIRQGRELVRSDGSR